MTKIKISSFHSYNIVECQNIDIIIQILINKKILPTKSAKKRASVKKETQEDRNQNLINDQKQIIRNIIDRDINVSAKNDSQRELIKNILAKEILICSGRAGTGKTYISLALALGLLSAENNKFIKIYLVKSVTTLKDEEVGYLKGDLKDKIEPFIWSFVLNVEKLIPNKVMKSIVDSDFIRPLPLAFIRGASIDNTIIIVDEVQNISLNNMRTLMTRIGENSKMIILGDTKQIDLKNKNNSSLSKLITMFKDVDEIGVIEMNPNDINVRNPIINKIEEKFDELDGNK